MPERLPQLAAFTLSATGRFSLFGDTRITPTRLAKAYADAGYFARNLRSIEVLIDRDAIVGGAAA